MRNEEVKDEANLLEGRKGGMGVGKKEGQGTSGR